MRLGHSAHGIPTFHSVREDFGEVARLALRDEAVIVALGPIYDADPAETLLAPFRRSCIETEVEPANEAQLAPDWALVEAERLRSAAVAGSELGHSDDLANWARAGLVLEIARRRGVHFGSRVAHFNWKLRGTVTGRFGCETFRTPTGEGINPLTMNEEWRKRCRPSAAEREIVVLDFKAMDVCSMAALVPEFASRLNRHPDPYTRITELMDTNLDRDLIKLNFLTWAYGGVADFDLGAKFRATFPEIFDFARPLEHGDFPRMVQTVSAQAFRSGLSRALPLLTGDRTIPMFCVHDELALDVSPAGLDQIHDVAWALEQGASQTIGSPYRVGVSTGYTYFEAKGG